MSWDPSQLPAIGSAIACVWQAGCVLGECPVFDPATGAVWFVDIKGLALLHWSPDGEAKRWPLPCRISSIDFPTAAWQRPASRADTILLSTGDRGFAWLELHGTDVTVTPIVHPEPALAGNRFNDGKVGPDGRYYAGTMDDAELSDTGSLYALAPDGSVKRLDTGYRVPNGPAFSPDGATVYHSDSFRRIIYAFDRAPDGALSRKRPLVAFAEADGCPDGMTVDADGELWVAMWDGGAIARIAPDGARIGAITCPTARMTSCAFADGGRTLFATSAAVGLKDDPLAGSLFRIALA